MAVKAEKPDGLSRQSAQPENQGTILLVDDEEIIRQLGIRILEKSGFRVMTAGDGREGVELYRQHRRDIDVVILDMTMPGMNGMETMAVIKEEFPAAKIMISTGHSMEGELEILLREGFCDVLMKPYRAVELTAKVKAAIAGKK